MRPTRTYTRPRVHRIVRRHIHRHPIMTLPERAQVIAAPLKKNRRQKRRMLALLIAAHNEEIVIENTIRSAIKAGIKAEDIYVVDDASIDTTSKIARDILGKDNVCRVQRSGKGLALTKGARKFKLTSRYRWIHIADADGGFAPNYFSVFRKKLSKDFVAATGYIKSLPGSNISQYRVYEYTIGMDIHRRFQAMTHTVSVVPGPTSCFRADIFATVDFANKSLTEDFDVTLQIHRRKLGKIQFIPEAVAYTQDPATLKDFFRQVTRWNRGVMQGIKRHKIGRRMQRIDAYLSYLVGQNLLFFLNYFVLVPFLCIKYQSVNILALTFLYDVITTGALTLAVVARSKRWDVLSAFPSIYVLRWVSMAGFLRAFVEVVILQKFRLTDGVWETAGRRYKVAASS